MIRCIVIDDEQLVRELLSDNIQQIPFLQLVTTCKTAMEAADVLQREQVDLLFLDIQMPRLNGLQFLQSLQNPPMVILVTAYEQYALEGFNLNVLDYLVKPFSFDRFFKACTRAQELYHLRNRPAEASYFFVHVEYTLVKIEVAEIDYIEGLKDYIKIYLSGAAYPILTRMTLKAATELLPEGAFIRTHKSYIVAIRKITSLKRDLVYIGEKEIPVSDHYKENVNRMIKGH